MFFFIYQHVSSSCFGHNLLGTCLRLPAVQGLITRFKLGSSTHPPMGFSSSKMYCKEVAHIWDICVYIYRQHFLHNNIRQKRHWYRALTDFAQLHGV